MTEKEHLEQIIKEGFIPFPILIHLDKQEIIDQKMPDIYLKHETYMMYLKHPDGRKIKYGIVEDDTLKYAKELCVNLESNNKSLWNFRFSPNAWDTTKLYAKAVREGFYIEALVLSINILKSMLYLAMESYFSRSGKSKAEITKILHSKIDIDGMIKHCHKKKILSPNLILKVQKYWNFRGNAVHNYIEGLIDYNEIKQKVINLAEIYKEIQDTFAPYTIGEEKQVNKKH